MHWGRGAGAHLDAAEWAEINALEAEGHCVVSPRRVVLTRAGVALAEAADAWRRSEFFRQVEEHRVRWAESPAIDSHVPALPVEPREPVVAQPDLFGGAA